MRIRQRGKVVLPERSDDILNNSHGLSCGTAFKPLSAYCTPESPGRLDPGRNNLRLFTIKCLQNCPKVAMLYNSRKTGVQIGNQIVDIFQTNMQANQGPAKIDLALWANGGDMFWLICQDQRFIPAPRVGHAE